jgi:hypothetical protein
MCLRWPPASCLRAASPAAPALAPLALELVVAAAIERQLALVEMDDVRRPRVVEQVAVVADDDAPCADSARDRSQPQRAFEVEIVGRLVEQQQVGLGRTARGERHAHAPAAGELRAGAALRRLVEAEARRGSPRRAPRRMRVDVGEPRLDLGDPVRIVAVSASASSAARSRSAASTTSIRRSVRRAPPAPPADARQCRGRPIVAGLGADLAGDQAEQRRLAGAVAADEPRFRRPRPCRAGSRRRST